MTARRNTPAALRRGMSPQDRLAIDVAYGSADDCWPWQGSVNRWGYGRVRTAAGEIAMHRVAYEAAHGPIPDGMVVRHSCDNPPCCNPAHLSVGTPADNRNDCVARDRHLRGERIPWAVLNDALVLNCRARYLAGDSVAVMAAEAGVREITMRRAIVGATWKHLPGGLGSLAGAA